MSGCDKGKLGVACQQRDICSMEEESFQQLIETTSLRQLIEAASEPNVPVISVPSTSPQEKDGNTRVTSTDAASFQALVETTSTSLQALIEGESSGRVPNQQDKSCGVQSTEEDSFQKLLKSTSLAELIESASILADEPKGPIVSVSNERLQGDVASMESDSFEQFIETTSLEQLVESASDVTNKPIVSPNPPLYTYYSKFIAPQSSMTQTTMLTYEDFVPPRTRASASRQGPPPLSPPSNEPLHHHVQTARNHARSLPYLPSHFYSPAPQARHPSLQPYPPFCGANSTVVRDESTTCEHSIRRRLPNMMTKRKLPTRKRVAKPPHPWFPPAPPANWEGSCRTTENGEVVIDGVKSTPTKRPREEEMVAGDRVIVKLQRFMGGKWGPEYTLRLSDLELQRDLYGNLFWEYRFHLGGCLVYYPEFLPLEDCDEIKNFVLDNHVSVLRQYPIQNGVEPRLHGLLDCRQQQQQQPGTRCVYAYHGIKMKSLGHVSDSPALEKAAKVAAAAAGIGGAWNIGCDVLVYRNLYDKIGWHADDTQEEACIFSIVPYANPVRALHIAPTGSDGKCIKPRECQEGYERLKIFPASCDAYRMDGEMQKFYVHSLPRVNNPQLSDEELNQSRRIALIFRHGCEKLAEEQSPVVDKGVVPATLKGSRPPTPEERHPFGPMREMLSEGKLYSRVQLLESRAFSCVQGGISGTRERGCSAIVVSRQSGEHFEADSFSILLYSSTGKQSAGAMFKTFVLQQNYVRVFRSTAMEGCYGARNLQATGKQQRQMYRYDGLYQILDCLIMDEEQANWRRPDVAPKGDLLHTFVLVRVPVGDNGNALSTEELLKQCVESGTVDAGALDDYRSRQVPRLECRVANLL